MKSRSWSEQVRQRGVHGQVSMLYVIAHAGNMWPPHFFAARGQNENPDDNETFDLVSYVKVYSTYSGWRPVPPTFLEFLVK